MSNLIWFLIFSIGIWFLVPIHFWSVEHQKLQKKFGKEKGDKRGRAYAMISGWGFFIFMIGIWISPQPNYIIPIFQNILIIIPIIEFSIPLFHLIISLPFLILAIWFGIAGVKGTGLKVSETHKPEKVISTGIYSIIRHPQYFGAILAHIGFSILLSPLYSLLYTPLIILYNYLVSWKEEKELLREFGKDYEDYKRNVPMLYPKLRK